MAGRRAAWIALWGLLAAGAVARAEGQAPEALSARLTGTTVQWVVRYRVAVTGPSAETSVDLLVPDHGVVTGATVAADGAVQRLALEGKPRADAILSAVRDGRPGPRRAWAIGITREYTSDVHVSVLAPRAATLTLDLELDTPTCFFHGARYASLPRAWRGSLDRAQRTTAAAPPGCLAPHGDDGDDDTGVAPRVWLTFPTVDRAARPLGDARVAAHGERLELAPSDGSFAHVELDLADRLADVPADLHTVFVVDASRSVSPEQLATAAATIRSYAQHAPQSQIQIVAFARTARAVLPRWTRARDVTPTALAALTTANGTNVDAGLAEGARWLAAVSGTRRVVLFTDERLGARVAGLAPRALQAALPAGTLVHVVALGGGGTAGAVTRDDEVALGPLALLTEGLAARARGRLAESDGTGGGAVDAEVLVRPLALERVAVHAPGWTAANVEGDQETCSPDGERDLAAGRACAWWGTAAAGGAAPIAITGLLWNHPITREVTPDVRQGEQLARMLTGFPAYLGSSEAAVEAAAHAVNRTWALVARWGGPDGYADDSGGGMGMGLTCGCGGGGLMGHGSATDGIELHLNGPTIAAQLARATAACHVDARVAVTIELTQHEIVDVAVVAPRAALRDCVTEAVWATALVAPDPRPHATETITLGP